MFHFVLPAFHFGQGSSVLRRYNENDGGVHYYIHHIHIIGSTWFVLCNISLNHIIAATAAVTIVGRCRRCHRFRFPGAPHHIG